MQVNDGAGAQGAKGAEDGKTLGRKLEAARVGHGLSLQDIAAELRMEMRAVRALEECRFDDVGPPVFAKGYLKLYAHRLGLDYNDLLAEYYRLVEPKDVRIEPSRTIKLHDERQITVWIIAAVAIVLVGVFLWAWLTAIEAEPPVPAAVPPQETPGGMRLGGAAGDGDAGLGGELARDAESRAPAGGLAAPDAPGQAEGDSGVADPAEGDSGAPGPAEGDSASSLVAADPRTTAQSPSPDPRANAAAPPVEVEGAVGVEIAFREDSWTEVTDADGRRLYYGLGRQGGRARFAAVLPIDVFFGNAGGVEVIVDGAPFDVPPAARQGNLARFSIDAPAN